MPNATALREEKSALVKVLLDTGVLMFGEFTLKSGRKSPYFFNLGAINTGATIGALGEAYAQSINRAQVDFACVFGPAYKGVPIAVATAQALAKGGRDVGWAFNRKEAKSHGEGGIFVGAPITGRLVLVDDVLTAGTAVREAAGLIAAAGAELAGIFIAMDRQEILDTQLGHTAVHMLQEELGVPVSSLLNLQDLIDYLDLNSYRDEYDPAPLDALRRYQSAHCALESAHS